MAVEETVVIDRDYVDNYSVKEFTENNLVEKYFPDVDASLRTVGMIGFTTEQAANISEDAFNTGSVLFRESFANRAQVPESIYSHAALFQLSNAFSTAASCTFLLVLQESSIISNMVNNYDKDTGIYYFYIDKNTVIYVEDIPFTIDYDIELKIVKKTTETCDEYLFNASYITDEYTNSISSITDPYIKIRRSNDGYVALEIKCHQCIREITYETLITNSSINYPIIDVAFDGDICGLDILYKAPSDTDYNTQLAKKVVYAQPTTDPFCYYQLKDENTIRISFNSKDGFFTPEFNSELEIILYKTEGESGNFDVYNGTNISVSTDASKYEYTDNYIVSAKPWGASVSGAERLSTDALQSLTVKGYQTANSLTTENDLNSFFSNFKYTYGNSEIKFLKRRDDVYAMIYSGFIVMKNGTYIYKTNCLNMDLNLSDMENPETNVYMIEPGLLFTSNDGDGYAHFLYDTTKHEQYLSDYNTAVKNNTIPYITDDVDKTDLPAYLDRSASFAEYKRRNDLDDKVSVFDVSTEFCESYDDPSEKKFLYINPFLIRFIKSPNLMSLYMTYISQTSLVDFTDQNEDSYIQFIMYQVGINRNFSNEKAYHFSLSLLPSITVDKDYPIISGTYDNTTQVMTYDLGDRFNVKNNDLRVFLVINDSLSTICYTELYPTAYNTETLNFTFEGDIHTDDHITSAGNLRILDNTIYRNPSDGSYYKRYSDDYTLYHHYSKTDILIEENIPVDLITSMEKAGTVIKWVEAVNMSSSSDILIPMSDVKCTIYMLYRRTYNEDTGKLDLNTTDQTSNPIVGYDSSLDTYIWTNEYNTTSDPLTFMKPLNNVRSNLSFKDFTATTKVDDGTGTMVETYTNDIMDVTIDSIPFIRWNLINDSDNLDYFMSTFLAQYNTLTSVVNTQLKTVSNIDVKFYNTYGRSKNLIIGESEEVLDTVNLRLSFDMWFVPGTDLLTAIPEVKAYIKAQVETINSSGMNNLFISNLMRRIESQYTYVDHIRFNQINNYDTNYQAVKNNVSDLNELTTEERRVYVPELLVIDLDDIIIHDYYAS